MSSPTAPARPRWPAFLVAAILSAGVAFTIYWLAFTAPIPFSRSTWIEAASHDDPTRRRMADGLVRDDRLIGKAASEVVMMLGVPAPSYAGTSMSYVLGQCRHNVLPGTEMLVVRFDDAGYVTAADVVDVATASDHEITLAAINGL